jgi:hypothetical protein
MKPSASNPLDMLERVFALKEHYRITGNLDEGGLMQLLLALAADHVPGFRFADESAALIPETSATRDLVLLVEVHKLSKDGGGPHSVRNAAAIVAKQRPDLGLTAKSARVRYAEMISKNSDRGSKRRLELAKLISLLEKSGFPRKL